MTGIPSLVIATLLLCTHDGSASRRQKRIVGGEKANPPPANATDAEDVVENPALISAVVTTTTTTKRPTTKRSVELDDGPIVFMRRGRREARVSGIKNPTGYYSFHGLRYAQPPLGPLRYQRPTQVKPEGDINATAPGPPCPQTLNKRIVGSEDCLFLNVHTPEIPKDKTGKKYPVLLWIHGGGYRRGSGSQYGCKYLVEKGLVVVTIQYRLGSLGFLASQTKELSGNAGLFDMSLAWRWVTRYIQFFGGDPNHIVVGGQNIGASAAQYLALNKNLHDEEKLKGIISMSGSSVSSFALDKEPKETVKEVSSLNNCKFEPEESLEFTRCMQKLSLEGIVTGDDKVQDDKLSQDNKAKNYITSISKPLNPVTVVEGEDDLRFLPYFLTATPQEILEKGEFAKVPLLIGVTKQETSTSAKGGGIASKLLGGVEASQEVLENIITELLQINTGIIGESLLNPLVKSFTQNVFDVSKLITSSLNGAASTVDKIIEVTTDALFNLPAFISSQKWSKNSKAYLYSFEYETSTSTASNFLQENPLTEQTTEVKEVGHGDDLIFLFDLLPLEGGDPLVNLTEPKDIEMRETFTNYVAEFVHTGEPKIQGKSAVPFSVENGDYTVINVQPSLSKGFRKCQMGVWAGLTDILKSAECSSLNAGELLSKLGVGELKDTTRELTKKLGVSNVTDTTSKLTGKLGGGLLGGSRDQALNPLGRTTARPQGGPSFGILG